MRHFQLPKKKLGKTDVAISALGLGTVKLGRNQGVKYPQSFTIPNDDEAKDLLALAQELGINFLDTAPAYGNSEERLGQLLRGQRDQWVICSKAGEEFDNGQSYYDFSPNHIRTSIERSLKRLDTDVIDILLIHSDGNDLEIINHWGALDTLAQIKQEGLIRAFGMSTKSVDGGLLAAQESDCVMVTYNLDHREEKPVLDYCSKKGVGVLLKKVLASGHICEKESSSPLDDSMQFVFSNPAVSSAVVGTINPVHLRANVDAAINALQKV